MSRFTVAWMASLALAGACAVAAPPALAAQSPVLTNCFANGALTHTYSIAQLRSALNTIPVSATEYTVCYDVIQRQLVAQLAKGGTNRGSSSGSGGSFLPTPVFVVLVLLALGAVALGAVAIRRRSDGSGPSGLGGSGGPGGSGGSGGDGPPGGPGVRPPDEPA